MEKSWNFCLNKLKKCQPFFLDFFFSAHHPDQMSDGSQVSKVTLCVEILKWHLATTKTKTRSGIELPGQLKIQNEGKRSKAVWTFPKIHPVWKGEASLGCV